MSDLPRQNIEVKARLGDVDAATGCLPADRRQFSGCFEPDRHVFSGPAMAVG